MSIFQLFLNPLQSVIINSYKISIYNYKMSANDLIESKLFYCCSSLYYKRLLVIEPCN